MEESEKDFWFNMGKNFYSKRKYEHALFCFYKAIEKGNDTIEVLESTGVCLFALNKIEQARQIFDYLKNQFPSNVRPLVFLSMCDILSLNPENACKNIDLALSLNKEETYELLSAFYQDYFELSKDIPSQTKAFLERKLETLKLR
jgi:tetratricopeptide (TPR) repeat protein